MPVHHLKQQPVASTYVREEGGVFYTNRDTPCRSAKPMLSPCRVFKWIPQCSRLSLDGVAGFLGDALHNDDELELRAEQRLRCHLEERTLLVNLERDSLCFWTNVVRGLRGLYPR